MQRDSRLVSYSYITGAQKKEVVLNGEHQERCETEGALLGFQGWRGGGENKQNEEKMGVKNTGLPQQAMSDSLLRGRQKTAPCQHW